MTAITLNLLAEEQLAQQERARDPLKGFIAIGIGVIAVVVALGGMFSAMAVQKRGDLAAIEARWAQIDDEGSEAGEFQKIKSLADDIVAINRSRALIAPQLAMVKEIVPPTIQLAQLDLALSQESGGGDASGEQAASGKKPARPKSSERLILRMDGRAVSSRPELEVDKFLQTLRTDARFSAAVEDIQLRSIARVSQETDKTGNTLPTANFVIECRYKAKESK